MLVLSRKINEKIRVGDDIVINACDIFGGRLVKIGIEAPKGVRVMREELIDREPREEGEKTP